MRSVAPPLRSRGRRDPAPLGELLGEALPPRIQRRLLGPSLVREVWETAVPEELMDRIAPRSLEDGVLTILAEDAAAAAEAHRRRKTIRERLLRAAGLPRARLRLVVRASSAGPPGGGE